MLAIVRVGFEMLYLEQAAFGRTMMHEDAEFAGLFIQLHGEIGRFFVEGFFPVHPAAVEAFGDDKVAQVSEVGIGKKIPEIDDSALPAFFFEKLEELAVSGDKISTGDHGFLLKKRTTVLPVSGSNSRSSD